MSEFIERNGKPVTMQFGNEEPERVREIMGFESENRNLEIRAGESGRVAIITTNKIDGETVTDSFTPESFYSLYIAALNMIMRTGPPKDPNALVPYKFFDARPR